MAAKTKLTDTELQALIGNEITDALPSDKSALVLQRSKAMGYYQGEPFGNEIEGRSSVVSTDVRDTVEWIMPTAMRIFTAGDDVVEFEPTTQKDVQFAKQATQYVNYIWMRDNPGFINFYTWFKDALLQKNGIIKISFDDSEIPSRERYSGLDDQTFSTLVNDKTITVSEHTERQEDIEVPQADPKSGQVMMVPQTITVHDLVVTRMDPGGRVCVDPVPPEEFLISKDGRSIASARMVGHRTRVTISDLREEGVSEEIIDKIGKGDDTSVLNMEEIARNTVEVESFQSEVNNPSMATVWRTECYIKLDYDGDGIAEMRKIAVAGNSNEILSNEAWDGARPFANITPVLMPHRFNGLSMADLIMDLQLIRSTIFRQYLDNLYLSNNQREEVVENNIIDPSEVLTSRPGAKIRVKVAGSVMPIPVQAIGQEALAGLAYVDQVRENRTGVSERTQGLGSNDLHETLGGEQMLMSAAMGKIELIARCFAETGVKDAFKIILGLVCRYQNKPRMIRLAKEWTEMDPRSWNENMDASVSVGLGTGDNQQKLQHAMMLGQAQAQAMMSGVLHITPENAMATADLLVNSMGLKGADRFFSLPDPNVPPKPDPEMAKVQAKAQADQAKAQLDAQMKEIQSQRDYDLETRKMMMEMALKQYQVEQELILKRQQIGAEFVLDAKSMQHEHSMNMAKLASSHQQGTAKIASSHALGKQKNQLTSQVHVGGQPG